MDIQYENFTAKGLKIVRGPNILARHINTLPFGLSVVVSDNYEPFLINDFVSGRVSLFLLDSDDVATVESMILAGNTVP